MIIWTLFWILGTKHLSVRQVVKKSMVPVSHQECVPVIKDGWGKTVLKVGIIICIHNASYVTIHSC